MPACSPFALRQRRSGRRKDGKSHVEFHHGEGGALLVNPDGICRTFTVSRQALEPSCRRGELVTWRTKCVERILASMLSCSTF